MSVRPAEKIIILMYGDCTHLDDEEIRTAMEGDANSESPLFRQEGYLHIFEKTIQSLGWKALQRLSY